MVWHVLVFKNKYQEFGYFDGEPNLILGIVLLMIQGFVLSTLYQFVHIQGAGMVKGIRYSLTMGAFLWTTHVLGYIAKQEIHDSIGFLGLESLYLFVQFCAYGGCS